MPNRKLRPGTNPKAFIEVIQSLFPKEGQSALAWMRAQAKAIQPDLSENAPVSQLARIISSRIVLKKRRVRLHISKEK